VVKTKRQVMGILKWPALGLLVVTLFGLGGCFRSGKPDHFYMLRAVAVPARAAPAGGGPLVGLGPIRIPAYLDRPQIVTAASGQEYRLSDEHRWAERLDDNIARVSAQNLSAYIPSDRIVPHPWPREPKPVVQVAINIQELHLDPVGEVRMSALWTLRYGKEQAFNRQFSCRLPASSADYALMVEAESQCLARLNRDIANAIRNLDLPG
jgi:uncharacterized lipoprotein YmbA